jgi:hypothetical protein
MYPFNQEEIDYYLPSGKDSGKAGGNFGGAVEENT